MRNKTWMKSTALAYSLPALLAYMFVFGNSSPLEKKGSIEKFGSGVNSTMVRLENLCMTPGCIHAASEVLKRMDLKIDPCENFYRYACGSYPKIAVIPDDKNSVNAFIEVEEKLNEQLRTLVRAEASHESLKAYRFVSNMFEACMNATAIEAKGFQPLKVTLKRLGGWPVVRGRSWKENNFDWISSIRKFRNVGYNFDSLIAIRIKLDPNNRRRRVIELSPFTVRHDRRHMLKSFNFRKVFAYFHFMVDIAVMLGAPKNRSVNELKSSLWFENQLFKILSRAKKKQDTVKLYHPMTLDELRKNYTSIPWTELFRNALPSSVTVENNDTVNVALPKYIGALEKLISRTPKRDQANYVIWNAVVDSIPYLNQKLRARQEIYLRTVSRHMRYSPRWKKCIDTIPSPFSVGIHAMYARKYLHKETKKNAVDLVVNTRKEFKRMLTQAVWIDEKTRNDTLEKVETVAPYVGYPDELLDDKKLEEFLKKYELPEDGYFNSYLTASRFATEFYFSRLREPFDDNRNWLQRAGTATVDALYAPLENSIRIPGGILQGIFFRNDRPNYMNYGAIGSVVGQELAHVFDYQRGRSKKKSNRIDWWVPSSKKHHFKRKSCKVNRYAYYEDARVVVKLNGINTRDERIADNGGIVAAYRAYKNWVASNGPEKMLPGINRTPEQMFWISFANVECSKERPQAFKDRITTGAQTPREYRFLQTLSKMPEFAKDFNCPVAPKMNPGSKCPVS